ncbi:hypothetical protein O6H91_16G006900 [Diphasiastrum complanatum]|uniref:Uncharacterized protein n=1 Tax=Diphasiastrum complanatum TaxID=34168 RepID=A0ACC2B9K9_DIPCM|nr:hypothetical protein O6H91_16G006900 [Diphasiastrum complanatum]
MTTLTIAQQQQHRLPDADGESEDVRIIRDVLSIQHVPVVGSMQWDQLQKILQMLVQRMSAQALRLDRAEEEGKLYKDELELCKNNIKEIQYSKESEQKWTKLIEERLGDLQQGLDATNSSLSHAVLPIQNLDLEFLQNLPLRVDTLEETAKNVNSLTVEMRETFNEQMENEAKHREEEMVGRRLQNLSDQVEELHQDFLEQTEKLHDLEVQHEQLKSLLQQTSKAQAYDLEALQKYCRNLRADFEMKPLLEFNGKGSEKDPPEPEKATPGLETAISELQSRLQKKADIESVEQLIRATQSTKEAVDKVLITVNDLQVRMSTRRASVTSASSRRGSRLSISSVSNQDSQNIGGKENRPLLDTGLFDGSLQKVKDDLMLLTAQVASKADRTALDDVNFRVVLLDGQNQLKGTTSFGDNQMNEDGGSGYKENQADESPLKYLKELLSRKVDRDELLHLQGVLQNQSSNEGLKELREDVDDLIGSVHALADRSDLSVLLSKRVDQIVNPAATVSGGNSQQDGLQAAINEHATRIMEYADMLLQMEAMLSSKADVAGLLALKAAIQELQQRRKTRGASIQLPAISSNANVKQTSSSILPEEMKEALKGHERMLEQLLKGVLIMSGQYEHYAPFTEQTEGTIVLKPVAGDSEDSLHLEASVSHSPLQEELPNEFQLSTINEAEVIGNRETDGSKENLSSLIVSSATADYEQLSTALEEALLQNRIQAKENAVTAAEWFQHYGAMEPKMEQVDASLSKLQDGLVLKADKIDVQKIARLVHEILHQPDRALFTGRPLLGFKCMSCDRPLEKLNPYRADYVPINMMPKQVLPMLSAERIFAPDRKEISSPGSPKNALSKDDKDSSLGYLQSPYTAPLPRRAYSAGQAQKPSLIKK